MKKKKIPSDEEAIKMIEEMVGVIKQNQFQCGGCGKVIVSDGTPKTRSFEWIEVNTGKKNKYCADCDDERIN